MKKKKEKNLLLPGKINSVYGIACLLTVVSRSFTQVFLVYIPLVTAFREERKREERGLIDFTINDDGGDDDPNSHTFNACSNPLVVGGHTREQQQQQN